MNPVDSTVVVVTSSHPSAADAFRRSSNPSALSDPPQKTVSCDVTTL
jgi:hypothetical protein